MSFYTQQSELGGFLFQEFLFEATLIFLHQEKSYGETSPSDMLDA